MYNVTNVRTYLILADEEGFEGVCLPTGGLASYFECHSLRNKLWCDCLLCTNTYPRIFCMCSNCRTNWYSMLLVLYQWN